MRRCVVHKAAAVSNDTSTLTCEAFKKKFDEGNIVQDRPPYGVPLGEILSYSRGGSSVRYLVEVGD